VSVLGAVALAVLGAGAVSAGAAAVGGALTDARDRPDGNDIAAVRFAYDRARGAIRADVTFYAPHRLSDDFLDVQFGRPRLGVCNDGASLVMFLRAKPLAALMVANPTAREDAVVVWSRDGRTLTLYAAAPELRSYTPTCGMASIVRDVAYRPVERTSTIRFGPVAAPHSPLPPTSIPGLSRRAVVHLGAIQVDGCQAQAPTLSVGPGRAPLTGRLELALATLSGAEAGRVRHISEVDPEGLFRFYADDLKPGRYRLTARYMGDRTRLTSKPAVAEFRVIRCDG
jgi:hypothetical protein